jgi:hypothetical protein
MSEPRDEDPPALGDLLPPLDGAPGPARRLSSARSQAMVASILDAARAPAAGDAARAPAAGEAARAPAAGEAAPAPAASPRRPGRARMIVLAAAILVGTAGVAAATGAWLADRDPVAGPAIAAASDEAATRPRRAPAPAIATDAGVSALDAAASVEPVEVDVDVSPAPDGPPRRPPRAAPPSPPAPPAPIEDLLAEANQARKDRRWRDAEALYEQVRRAHPGTDAAVVATVASASLHLDRLGDPAGALRRFRQALRDRPDGPLAEEARWGVAASLRATGDAAAEQDALRAFVAAHPGSARLDSARRRLAELDALDGAAP